MSPTPGKPMLAAQYDESRLVFPLYIQPKLDGIRATVHHSVPLSRTLKPIRNEYIRQQFWHLDKLLDGLDGELMVGEWSAKDVYNKTNSGVMSQGGVPDFTFAVFDYQKTGIPYTERQLIVAERVRHVQNAGIKWVKALGSQLIYTVEELLAAEQEYLLEGYEGAILRKPKGVYKHGRSTAIELNLMKLKRFTDCEGHIVGFEELMRNKNEAFLDERGYTTRSSHQANLVPGNTLGVLVCHYIDEDNKVAETKLGTGFDAALRAEIWANRDKYMGKLVKFKHFAHGAKDAARHPVFLGFRDIMDVG